MTYRMKAATALLVYLTFSSMFFAGLITGHLAVALSGLFISQVSGLYVLWLVRSTEK